MIGRYLPLLLIFYTNYFYSNWQQIKFSLIKEKELAFALYLMSI